jgi:hemerythrin-like domain-containing protein
MSHDEDRRRFLHATVTGAGLLVVGTTAFAAEPEKKDGEKKDGEKKDEEQPEDVSPAEDLMREHGLLNRVLLIYGEAIGRLHGKRDLPAAPLESSAQIIKTFIEDYHEKLEEDHLFPRFEKAGKLVDLTKVLREQHKAGRRLTTTILSLANDRAIKKDDDRRKLVTSLEQFVHMYRPHEAREDTILFPALHSIVSRNEYDSLGEQFEDEEHKRFGEEGFEKMVDKVADIEKELNIYDLAQFTPKE